MKRDKTLDVLKGIAIILMIIGHCPDLNVYVHNVIYSFHMPLFFLVTGYLYKQKDWSVRLRSDVKALIVPYTVFAVLVVLISHNSWPDLKKYGLAILCADGAWQPTQLLSYKTAIGCLWFLPAMFWARQVFNIILKSRFWLPLSFAIAIAGYYIQTGINLPFAINEGLVATSYLAIGYYAAHSRVSIVWIVFCIVCWLSLSWWESYDMACYKYENFPLCITAALGGALLCYAFSMGIKETHVGSFLAICGKYTLSILCLHALSASLAALFFDDKYYVFALRIVINIVLVAIWIIYKENRTAHTPSASFQ